MKSNKDKPKEFKSERFKAKKFEAKKIEVKGFSQEEMEANYRKSLSSSKERNKAIKKFFLPLNKLSFAINNTLYKYV